MTDQNAAPENTGAEKTPEEIAAEAEAQAELQRKAVANQEAKEAADKKQAARKEAQRLSKVKGRNESRGKDGDFVWKCDTKRGGKRYLCGEVCQAKGQELNQLKKHGLVVRHEEFKGKLLKKHANLK